MSWQKRLFHFVISVGLGASVLVAQLCNVACLAAACAETNPAPATSKSSDHCHQTEAPVPQDSSPTNESHSCQTHDWAVRLAASETLSVVTGQSDWQPVALLPSQLEIYFLPPPKERVCLSALRSPPRIPQRLVLRI